MKRLFRTTLFFAAAYALAVFPSYAAVANLAGNPGFENSLGGANNWNNDAGRGISNPVVAGAPEGSRVLRLTEAGLVFGEFSYTFQSVGSAKPGDVVALSAVAREVALSDDDDGQIRIEFKNSAGGLISDVVTSITAGTFGRVVASGIAPDGTAEVVFTLRIQNAGFGEGDTSTIVEFDDIKGTVNGLPVLIQAGTTGDVHSPGDLTMVSTRLQNTSADVVGPIELVATPTAGISIHTGQASLDGGPINQHEGSVVFELGKLSSGQDSAFAFAALLSSGVVPGKRYEITLIVRNAGSGAALSDLARVVIEVEPDPLFTMGTIIGKVFNDKNANEEQDPGEEGIPNARIATEQGIVVYTDSYGKYHIPQVTPGRHVVKIDYHSLPQGTQFVTEESYLAKITDGLLAKVNFAVKLPDDEVPQEYKGALTLSVIQELDRIAPELSVDMEPEIVRTGQGMLESPVRFLLHTNYGNLIKEWRIEVRDEMGEEIWSGIGKGAPPPDVRWDGKDNNGIIIQPGDYALRLVVLDGKDKEDWTSLRFFRVMSKAKPWENASETRPFSSVGYFNMMADGKRSIPITGRTAVRVQGKTPVKNQVTVNRIPVAVNSEGTFETGMFLADGQQKIEVTTTTEQGESLSVQKEVEIKDNYLFMVGLGEDQMGFNNFKGNVESVANDSKYRDGFYQDGRISYYLKGKIKGKFLVSSQYDSDSSSKRSKLFTSLDPDAYYPVYGDKSQLDFTANDSQGKFFVLVEKDRSFLKWGNFNTDFTDTELATHNRTGYGGKVHFETVTTTSYGDAKSGFSGFHTEQKQQPDHNEFVGTGGSLYYLRNRHVVEGSEKLRIENRDELSGVVISKTDMISGTDYEIDYDEGRIILNKPLSSVAGNSSLVNLGVLDGNSNVLVVDYEYKEQRVVGYGTNGLRGFQHFGDHVKVGGTYIEDGHPPNNRNYTMRGVDSEFKIGTHTKVNAEYAQSENPQLRGYTSANGGLSFANYGSSNLSSPEQGRNGAYVIRAQSKPLKQLEVGGYIQKYNPFFSNADTVFSQGDLRKYGVEANYRVTNNFVLHYRRDSMHTVKRNDYTGTIDRVRYHTVQADYNSDKVLTQLEYRNVTVDIPTEARLRNSLFSVNEFNDAVAAKIGYHVTDAYMPYARAQMTFNGGKPDNQVGAGLEARVLEKSTVSVEQNFGNVGTSTQLKYETQTSEKSTAYAKIAAGDDAGYGKAMQTTLGTSHTMDNRSRLFTEKEFSGYRGDNFARNTVGYERSFLDDRLGGVLAIERNDVDRAKESGVSFPDSPILNDAYSLGLTYQEGRILEASTKWEFRKFRQEALSDRQWLSYNNLGIQITKDLEFFSRFNLSKTRDIALTNTLADFVEMNSGFAFRPVEWDRFNALTRYTYLNDNLPDNRFGNGIPLEEVAHIFALEGAYDFNRYWELVEKFAYKLSEVSSSLTGALRSYNYLWINRVNFHVTRKWDLGLEYRILTQQGVGQNYRHGALVELDRELFDYTRIGVGYNFTDFDDDLRKVNSYQSFSQGPFVRLTGKF